MEEQIQMMYSMDPNVQDLEVSIQYIKPGNKWMYNISNWENNTDFKN